MADSLDKLQSQLQYQFKDQQLARLALTHRSANKDSNERLEFLGDALLDFLIGELLYRRFPDANEGELSRTRAKLVNKRALAEIGLGLGLGDLINRSSGDLKSGGKYRQSVLADTVEAIIAAVYLDGGMEASQKLIERLSGSQIRQPDLVGASKDHKTRLQELMQAAGVGLPEYAVLDTTGEAHAQTFHIQCRIATIESPTTASGSSKREAEQEAARKMLDKLECES